MLRQKIGLKTLILSITISILTVVASFVLGNQGYDAYIAVSLSIAILIIANMIIGSYYLVKGHGVIGGLITAPLFIIVSLLFVVALIMMIFNPVVNPKITIPEINWWIVIFGQLPIVLSRVGVVTNTGKIIESVGYRFSFLSVSVLSLFMAGVFYYGIESRLRTILLILAVELVFVLALILQRTDFLQKSIKSATLTVNRLRVGRIDRLRMLVYFLIVGSPYYLPLILITAIGSIGK